MLRLTLLLLITIATSTMCRAFIPSHPQAGTATAFGMTFQATTSTPGAEQMMVGTVSADVRHVIFQIFDVQIEVARVKYGDSYNLTVDDKSYGAVHSGDQVVVIKSKEVTVNGKPRHTD